MLVRPPLLLASLSLALAGAVAAPMPLAHAHDGSSAGVEGDARSTPTPPPTAPAPAESEWSARYSTARAKMITGDFAGAATDFDELTMTAPNPTWKVVAGEQAAICRTWVARKVALVKKSDLADTSVSAKAAGVRTTDEIAILYTNAVFYGIGTGLWIDSLTEPREAAGVILPVLAFAGGAAGVVALIDNAGAPMKYGVAQSMVTGLYLGFEEGLTWALYNQASSSRQDQWSGKTVATLVWGAATLGAVGGYVIGSVKGTTPGRASYVGSTGLWASVVSGLLGAAVSANDDRQDDHALLAAAIGLNAGIVAGLFTAGDVSPSIARVGYLDLGGIAGGLLFGGLYTAAANRGTNGQALAGTTATGIAVGLVTAWLATRNMAPDTLDAKTRARPSSSLVSSIAPSVAPTQGGAVLSLGGAF